MVFNSYVKQRILYHYLRGHHAPTIACLLREESLAASRSGVDRFLKKFEETECISRTPGSGRPTKAMAEIKAIVEQKMHEDDETMAYQLHQLLITRKYYTANCALLPHFPGVDFPRQHLLPPDSICKQEQMPCMGTETLT